MTDYTKFDPNNPPPPLMTGEPNSFAYRTMTTRIPVIVQQVLADHANKYPIEIVQALQDLYDEIKSDRPIRPLETTVPDAATWAEAWKPYQGKSWLNVPWYFAEAFFYRRLLEAVGYFGRYGDEWEGTDPFKPRKLAELESHQPWLVLSTALNHATDNSATSFRALLHHCVWGNRIDLSYNKVAESTGREISVDTEQSNLLVDDTEAVLAQLIPNSTRGVEISTRYSVLSPPKAPAKTILDPTEALTSTIIIGGSQLSCIDFICDNTGTELLLDLALADFLLRFDWAQEVTLHLKAHPTFVSDAVAKDIDLTITAIRNYPRIDLSPLAARLEKYREQHRLKLQTSLFWNSSHFFWEMPVTLKTQLAQARLVIIKGDANYRRLLGDSRWPPTVPVVDAIPYFPAPFVALRTMKSDPIVGLKPGLAEMLDKEDSEWRVNGKRGMIQALL